MMGNAVRRFTLTRRAGSPWASTALFLMAAALLLSARLTQAAPPDDALQTQGRLLTEERRQGNVRRQLSGVVRQIDLLMLDLASNDLFQEGGGTHVTQLNRTLAALNSNQVPKAEAALKQARQDRAQTLPRLADADREVSGTVRELGALLQEMGLTLTEDTLLAQLRSILKTQELLRRETAEWGKRLLVAPEAAGQTHAKLVQAQHTIRQQVETFVPQLASAAGTEADAPRQRRFRAAAALLRKSRPEAIMQTAAREIEASQPIAGVEQQDLAIQALRAAEDALAGQITDDLATIREVLEHLRQILKDQQSLQKEVKEANAQQFRERHFKLQARQTDIGKDLKVCSEQAVKTPAGFAVRKALEAMKEAQQELGKTRQEPALVQQEEAIVSLLVAIEALTAISALPKPELADVPEYPWPVQQLSTEPPVNDAEELLELDPTLSKKLWDMGNVVEGGGKVPSGPMPPSPADPNQSNPADKAKPPAEQPSSPAGRGKAVALSPEQIETLERRHRAAVYQNYANRLPKEFRQQVSDYYEALAE